MSDGKHSITVHAPRGELAQHAHPLVEAGMRALALNPDPATLRELLALQREWEQGEARKAYSRALVALKGSLPVVLKRDKKVDFTGQKGRVQYTHTSLAHALEEITPHLTAHGFSLAWTPARNGSEVVVTCRLTHGEGHAEECTLSAPVDSSGNKSPAQGVASTVTLLSRYTALSLLGIATADMKDPEPAEPDADHVDPKRNLLAVGKLVARGIEREAAEKFLGRPVNAWTSADIERLRAWVNGEVDPENEP